MRSEIPIWARLRLRRFPTLPVKQFQWLMLLSTSDLPSTQATSDGCYSRQSVCLVISLESGMSRAVHPQRESLRVVVEHWHRPLSATHSGRFSLSVASSLNLSGWRHVWSDCYLLRQSSGERVWTLPPQASIAKLEAEAVETFSLICFLVRFHEFKHNEEDRASLRQDRWHAVPQSQQPFPAQKLFLVQNDSARWQSYPCSVLHPKAV